MEQQSTQLPSTSISPGAHIGLVTVRVADMERSLAFYEGILGFRRVGSTPEAPGVALLGADDGVPLLELRELPGAPPQPRRATGLYHVAIVLPSRADLGRELMRMVDAGLDIGQGDHLVSEALYISDPDENGLELYRDRPRDEWPRVDGAIRMASDPVDMNGLLEEARNVTWETLPAGTRVGHIHLRVADLAQAEYFYHDVLGFDVMAQMPGALFVSAGGYHHHIGMNTWESRGASPTPETVAGLQLYVIALPDRDALSEVQTRLSSHGIPFEEREDSILVADPWSNQIKLEVE